MDYSGSFAGAGPRFGAERPYDARFEGMRPATVVDEAEEVGNVPLNDGRDPNFFHFTGEHYSGYDNASEPIPGGWPGTWSQNRSQDQETWVPEPPPNFHQHRLIPQVPICPGEACHCNETKKQLGQREQELSTAIEDIEALKIQLFNTWKVNQPYDKAETIYRDILTNHPTDADVSDTILALRYSFAEMLMEQKKFEDAETVAEKVWEARNARNSSSELCKMSHRQICSIYSSLGKFEKAENSHRRIYHQGPKNAWTLENGDGVCRQLVERGLHEEAALVERRLYEEAALVQLNVWKERQKLETQGPRHDLTIRSGLERISTLEKLSTSLAGQEGTEVQNERNRKQWYECEIDVTLQDIWGCVEKAEHIPELLSVGHKLGSRFIAQKKFAEAEAVLDEVWAGKKANFGEANAGTMATGRLLANALKLSESAGKYQRAAVIYEKIWSDRKSVFGESDEETISVGADLAETHCLLRQHTEAERVYRWVMEQRVKKLGRRNPKALDARHNLGRTIYTQGQQRYGEARKMLREVYDAWYRKAPKDDPTLQCGLMLVETLAEQTAIEPIREVFDGRAELPEKDRLYLESGHLLGRVLLQQHEYLKAQEILRPLWECQLELPEEKQVRFKCGHLYGRSLFEENDCTRAKAILESVLNAQVETFGTGSSEAIDISRLLETVQETVQAQVRKGPKVLKIPKKRNGTR